MHDKAAWLRGFASGSRHATIRRVVFGMVSGSLVRYRHERFDAAARPVRMELWSLLAGVREQHIGQRAALRRSMYRRA